MRRKIKALTLAEILIALVVIGITAAVAISQIKPKKYSEEENRLKLSKILNSVSSAASNIREDLTLAPEGAFLVNQAGTTNYFFAIRNTSNAEASVDEVISDFKDYLKTNASTTSFKAATNNACSSVDETIKGYQVVGNAAIGFEKLDTIADCPTVTNPIDLSTGINPGGKCWGKIHINTDIKSGQCVLNANYFVYGLNGYGIAGFEK